MIHIYKCDLRYQVTFIWIRYKFIGNTQIKIQVKCAALFFNVYLYPYILHFLCYQSLLFGIKCCIYALVYTYPIIDLSHLSPPNPSPFSIRN